MSSPLAAIVMAGGRGVRMRSATTKMLMPVCGRPLVYYPTRRALEVVNGPVVVVSGEQLNEVRDYLQVYLPGERRLRFARQEQPLGTADAVKAGVTGLMPGDGVEDVLILNGDVPAMSAGLLQRFIDLYRHQERDVGVLAFRAPDPTGYGRIINDDEGHVIAIREEQELADDQRSIDIVNAGIYLAKVHHLAAFLEQVKPSPNQREFLLTDLVEYIVAQGGRADVLVAPDAEEVAGVNDRVQLAEADARLRQRRNRELMKTGVGMPHPESVDVEEGIEVGPDTVLEAGVVLRGATCLGSGCTIGIGSVIEDTRIADNVIVKPYCVLESSIIDSECVLGPFAHTRPGTVLNRKAKVGNFVETKKTVLGEGSKASHLTYLGDATIGKGVNIGAGTITCNYDGYKKYPTVIEDGAFVGSDTQFVAPVRIGTDAVVGAGTTVTRDVPAGALAVSRMKQENKDGYVARKKDRMTTAGKE